MCRQSRMEHKGLRPLINPGVFRQALRLSGIPPPAILNPGKNKGGAFMKGKRIFLAAALLLLSLAGC